MAEQVTAASMGESIGLGYRAKDITPQLMQFQAADLARKSAARSAEKKEKQAEGDKILERIIPYETKSFNKKVQGEANKFMASARLEIQNAINEGDHEKAMKRFAQTAQQMNEYEKRSKNYDDLLAKDAAGVDVVPEDVKNWVSSTTKETQLPTEDQIFQWKSMGINFDPVTKIADFKGYKKRDDVNELFAYNPTIDTFKQFNITPTTSKQPTVAGQQSGVSLMYVPNDAMWEANKKQLLSDNEVVVNGVNRIARSQGKTYGEIALAKRNDMISKGANPNELTYEVVNRQIVNDDLDINHKDKWIKDHTKDENMNPVPKATGGKSGKDDFVPNPTAVVGTEHLTKTARKAINSSYPAFKDYTDKKLIEISQKPFNQLNADEKKIKVLFDAYERKGVVFTQSDYPTVQVQLTTDILTLPSSKKSATQKVDTVYYNKDDGKFYATLSTTGAGGGANAQVLEQQIPLKVEDLQALQNAAKTDKRLEAALLELNGNAGTYGYETMDEWISSNAKGVKGKSTTTTSKPVKISVSEFNTAFEKSRKNNPGLTEAKFSEWLLKTHNKTK